MTLVERPSRFGYSVLMGDITSAVEYTILPEGSGSLVKVEADQRSPSMPLTVMLVGAVMEGRTERNLLDQLKAAIEAGGPASPTAT